MSTYDKLWSVQFVHPTD